VFKSVPHRFRIRSKAAVGDAESGMQAAGGSRRGLEPDTANTGSEALVEASKKEIFKYSRGREATLSQNLGIPVSVCRGVYGC